MKFRVIKSWRQALELLGALSGALIAVIWLAPSLFGNSAFVPADYWFRFSQWTPKFHELYNNVPYNDVLYDVALHLAPLIWISKDAWANFELPLWNPYFRCGMPLLGNGQSGILSLTNIPHWVLPWPLGFAVAAVARFGIMWSGAWCYARILGIARIPAAVLAFGFCFMPAFMSWFQHPNANGEIFFPWMLWSVELIRQRWPRKGHGPYLLFPGLFFSFALLGGHFHSTFNIMFCTSLYALVVLPWTNWRSWLFSRASFGLSVIAGFFVAAPTVFPALSVMLDSSTLIDRSKGTASWHLTPEMLKLFWNPLAFGSPLLAHNKPWSTQANWPIIQQYIGLMPLVLCIAGIVRGQLLDKSLRKPILGFTLITLLAGSLAYGWYPLHKYLTKIPPFSINTNPYFAIGVQAAIITCACLMWKKCPHFTRPANKLHLYLWTLSLVFSVGMSLILYKTHVLTSSRPMVALTASSLSLLTLWLCRGLYQKHLAWTAVLLCTITDVVPVWDGFHYQVPKSWALPSSVESNVISKLQSSDMSRVISDACYAPNTLAFFDTEDIRAYDSPIHLRHTLWRSLIRSEGIVGIDIDNLSTAQLSDFKSMSILSLTAATGLVSLVDYRNNRLQEYIKYESNDGPVRLYSFQNPVYEAAAYNLESVQYAENTTVALNLLKPWDLSQPYLPTIEAKFNSQTTSTAVTPEPITINSKGMRHIGLKTQPASVPRWVVIRESYDDGWKAYINKTPAEIYPADVKFMAVKLPPGAAEITMKYTPTPFLIGLILSVGVMAGSGFYVFYFRQRQFRGREQR